MFNKTALMLLALITLLVEPLLISADAKAGNNPYVGQVPPGDEPVLFAPGIISDGFNNRDLAMMPDGSEIYYAVNMRSFDLSTILVVHQHEDGWSQPEVAPFATNKDFKY